ncbi:MAG: alpha/beta fold hydrolase [bacterium]
MWYGVGASFPTAAQDTPPQLGKVRLPPVFEQAAIETLSKKKFQPTPLTVARVVEDSPQFRIESVRYRSEDITTSGLLAIPKNGAGPYPAVVICHGYYPPASYFQGLGTRDTLEALATEGFVVFIPDYRGYPPSEGQHTYPYPGEVIDIVQAFVSLSRYPKVDAKRMGLIGYSMGGGLALQSAEILGRRVKAFVNYYGQLGGFSLREDELVLFLNQGLNLSTVEAIFKARSPFYHLDLLTAPVLIFHGENDRTVSITQSLMLRNELLHLGKPVKLVTFPEYGHAFGDSFQNKSFPQLVTFLKTHLRP